MTVVDDVCQFLEEFAPSRLAEDWDNVGLLTGDRRSAAQRIMTCLTVTPDSAAEAIESHVELIVSHHPLPFRSLKRITTDTSPGRLLWRLIGAGVAIYSPHTAYDGALRGINQRLAEGLKLEDIAPLTPLENDSHGLGAGRWGRFSQATPLSAIADRLKAFLKINRLRLIGDSTRVITNAAVACGSGGSFLEAAIRAQCQLLVTGETTFHTCLEAQANETSLLLPGHYATEHFAVEALADVLAAQFPQATVWASRRETDPIRWA